MVTNLFKLSVSLAVLTIWAGIVTAAFAGGQKPIELGWMPRAFQWIATSGEKSTEPEVDPKPFVDIAKDSADKVRESLKSGAVENPTPQPSNAPKPLDVRLAACPDGSFDPIAPQVPLEQALRFKQQVDEGLKPTTLLQVQSALGQPNCVISGKAYHYLIFGSRAINASIEKAGLPLKLIFTGF
jgi:hypothetical protein